MTKTEFRIEQRNERMAKKARAFVGTYTDISSVMQTVMQQKTFGARYDDVLKTQTAGCFNRTMELFGGGR